MSIEKSKAALQEITEANKNYINAIKSFTDMIDSGDFKFPNGDKDLLQHMNTVIDGMSIHLQLMDVALMMTNVVFKQYN